MTVEIVEAAVPSSATLPPTTSKSTKQSKAWHDRQPERRKQEATKALERSMKEEKETADASKRERIKERKLKAEEKARLEQMAKSMSEKKLKRMKRRLGRSKKVAG